jgi:hypothetical protein
MNTPNAFRFPMTADRLVLTNEQFSERMLALFAELNETEGMREVFLDNPASVIRERILDAQIDLATGDNRANRFLFALLSSSRFRRWLAEYQEKILWELKVARAQLSTKEGMRVAVRLLDRRHWLQDLTEGLKVFGEESIYRALLPPGVALEDSPVPPVAVSSPLIISHDMLVGQMSAWLDNILGSLPYGPDDKGKPGLVSHLTDDQLLALYEFFYRCEPQQKVTADAAREGSDVGSLASVACPSRILLRQFATIITQQLALCIERLSMSRKLDEQCAAGRERAVSGGHQ